MAITWRQHVKQTMSRMEKGTHLKDVLKEASKSWSSVICDDGKERRCIIRGKFTGRNKRDNMLDCGTYILVGLREWTVEDIATVDKSNNKNVRYCDLLEVYNSMERDILRRTHGVFGTLKDESGAGLKC